MLYELQSHTNKLPTILYPVEFWFVFTSIHNPSLAITRLIAQSRHACISGSSRLTQPQDLRVQNFHKPEVYWVPVDDQEWTLLTEYEKEKVLWPFCDVWVMIMAIETIS